MALNSAAGRQSGACFRDIQLISFFSSFTLYILWQGRTERCQEPNVLNEQGDGDKSLPKALYGVRLSPGHTPQALMKCFACPQDSAQASTTCKNYVRDVTQACIRKPSHLLVFFSLSSLRVNELARPIYEYSGT